MRVLICGDRNWTDFGLIHSSLSEACCERLDAIQVIIDGAAKGADSLGHELALQLKIPSLRFPARWDTYGKGAGPKRNQQMLDEGHPTLVLAFHDDLEHSKGTKDMVRRAQKAGVPVRVITHKAT